MGEDNKKLIVICQAGGEFVKDKDGSFSYNGGDARAIDIDSETKFDDFRLELAELWNYSPETMTVKYLLPGNVKTPITIASDKDLKRMIIFHSDSRTADVFVVPRDNDDTSVLDGIVTNSVESKQPAAIAMTAASSTKHHTAVEWENTITGGDQRFTNVPEFRKCSKKILVGVEMEAETQRSVALALMKNNDYLGARKKLLDAQKSYPELEYIDELIKVCDIVCTAESQLQGSGIDWYSILQTNKTANESDIEFKYTELIRNLEPVKDEFPEIQSALQLIEKAYSVLSNKEKRYEFDWRRAGSLAPCGSVKPLDKAHSETGNINRGATSQRALGTKRVSEGSYKNNLVCREQPLKRVRSLVGDDCEVTDESNPVFGVALESLSPNPPPAIAVTAADAAKHHRAVEWENTITGLDHRVTSERELGEALRSKKKLVKVEMEAAEIRRSVALILMKHDDYVGARNKLLDARKSYPGLEYVNELIKVCEMACTAESGLEGSGIDWYSVLQINKTANKSDIEFKYKEMIRALEPIKDKFPEIQSALGLIEEAYSVFSGRDKRGEFDCRRVGSLRPCGSAKPLDIAHSQSMSIDSKASSQSLSGTKRIVSKYSDKSNLLCNSPEQPLKRTRSLGRDDSVVIAENQPLNKLIGKVCGGELNLDTA